MISFPAFMTEFFQRCLIVVSSEVIDHAMSYDSLDVLKNLGGFSRRVGQEVDVIGHDHVSEQKKAA